MGKYASVHYLMDSPEVLLLFEVSEISILILFATSDVLASSSGRFVTSIMKFLLTFFVFVLTWVLVKSS